MPIKKLVKSDIFHIRFLPVSGRIIVTIILPGQRKSAQQIMDILKCT